ncbi:MAG TPA: DUF5671 domain-containing protein [Candidatus Lustribacter sp.]|nr:DUF5671 domain-containing protein [Candidatus Lustribacter sp.]
MAALRVPGEGIDTVIAGLFSLVLLALVAAAVVGVVNAVRQPHPGHSGSTPAAAARRFVVFALLFVLVVIAAIGVSGLLGRLLDLGNDLAGADVSGLALSLTFALIGGASAALLWWVLWRHLDTEEERSSIPWSLYVAGVATVALITATMSLMSALAQLIGGRWEPQALASAIIWAGVWVWHRAMAKNRVKSPTRLTDLAPVAGSTYGLLVGAGAAVATLQTLFDAALETFGDRATIGDPWWVLALQSLIWAVGGAAVWWWHWVRDESRRLDTGAADAALVLVGIVAAAVLALGGAGTVLYTVLRLGFDRVDPASQILEPLPLALSALAVGALVWTFHRAVIAPRGDRVREASRLLVSGVGLVATATGIGIIVNSILDASTATLAGAGGRGLLLGGLSALVVGAPVWWLTWQPLVKITEPERVRATGRRVYLVAVFGASAVVALVTLLVIGYRVFELALGDLTGEGLVERVRAPFGLLVATGLVAGYHYSVWRGDRSLLAAHPVAKTVGSVILVTGSDPGPLTNAISDVTGAAVTVWLRAGTDLDGPSEDQVAQALAGVSGRCVMVLTGAGGRIEVIPLQPA